MTTLSQLFGMADTEFEKGLQVSAILANLDKELRMASNRRNKGENNTDLTEAEKLLGRLVDEHADYEGLHDILKGSIIVVDSVNQNAGPQFLKIIADKVSGKDPMLSKLVVTTALELSASYIEQQRYEVAQRYVRVAGEFYKDLHRQDQDDPTIATQIKEAVYTTGESLGTLCSPAAFLERVKTYQEKPAPAPPFNKL